MSHHKPEPTALARVLWAAVLVAPVPALAAQDPPADRHPSTYYDNFHHSEQGPAQPAPAAVDLEAAPKVSWTNAAGGSWSDAGNWSGGAVPGKGDHVVIDLEGTYTVTLDGNAVITALTLGGASGTQTLAVPRDALVLRGPGTVGPQAIFELSGGRLGGDGDLVVEGRMAWSGGSMTGRGKVRIPTGGLLAIVGRERKILSLRHLENSGALVWRNTGNLVVTFASQIKNLEEGTFEVASGALLDVYGPAGPAVENAGTLRVTAAGATTFETPLTNSGTVEIGGGGLQLPAGYTQTAGVTTLAAARLAAPEILIGGGVLSGDGVLEGNVTNGGRIDPGAASGRVEIVGDYLQIDSGELRLDLGSGDRACDELTISGQATLDGSLELVWAAGSGPGAALEVVRFGSREGNFSHLTGLVAPDGKTLELHFGDNSLTLRPRG